MERVETGGRPAMVFFVVDPKRADDNPSERHLDGSGGGLDLHPAGT
jgi:hypothetical protein